MYECEEFSDGLWNIRRPDGKIVGGLSCATVGGAVQEDWYLITSVPPGNSTHAVYVWPGPNAPDVTHRYERLGAGGGAPSFPSGITADQWRNHPVKV